MGLKLKKINKILEFNQSLWLKKYIDFNTNLRTKAKNNFEKDFFQINEQFRFWKINGEHTKPCSC